jgi:hypothetical protein
MIGTASGEQPLAIPELLAQSGRDANRQNGSPVSSECLDAIGPPVEAIRPLVMDGANLQ